MLTHHQNHSCEPNCRIVGAFVNETDIQKPFMAAFTTKRVRSGEELTFDYAPLDEDEDEVVEKVPPPEGLLQCLILNHWLTGT